MPNYSTDLSTWGDTGSEYPSGYSYEEGEQPVDAWDDFLVYHTIQDIQHLINVTNNDLVQRDGGKLLSDLDFDGYDINNVDAIWPSDDQVEITQNLWVYKDIRNVTNLEVESISGGLVNRTEKIDNLPGNIYVTQQGASDPTQNDGDIWLQHE